MRDILHLFNGFHQPLGNRAVPCTQSAQYRLPRRVTSTLCPALPASLFEGFAFDSSGQGEGFCFHGRGMQGLDAPEKGLPVDVAELNIACPELPRIPGHGIEQRFIPDPVPKKAPLTRRLQET